MSRLTFLIVFLGLVACGKPDVVSPLSHDRPMRIVSLDYCADQYVIKLADPDQILAVSPDATKPFSYMREAAIGLQTVRPIAEDVLIMKPDLVVRSYGGGPNAAAFFERAGIPVLQVGWASKLNGDEPGTIPFLIQTMADGLGQSDRGLALVADYNQRLAALQQKTLGKTTLYTTPSGVTTGSGSLIHEAMLAAGLENYIERSGWHSLPLEQMVFSPPEQVATAHFGSRVSTQSRWSAARHPIAERALSSNQRIDLDGAWTSCGSWAVLEAVEALSRGPDDSDP